IRLLILGSGYNTMISHLGLIRTFLSGKPGFGSDGGLFREPIGDLTGPVYRKSKILTGLLKGRWYQG
ncbi:hypothetical protein, partial [Klebsiella quasivariicola]|uniref:hypothetical protein n=1 Tax=Klebsiella quasivariicola TaxID=2026240 RepID=UPI001C49BD68